MIQLESPAAPTKASGKKQLIWWLEGLVLTAGLLCVFYVGWKSSESWFYQTYESFQLQQSLRDEQVTWLGYAKYLATSQSRQDSDQLRQQYTNKVEREASRLQRRQIVRQVAARGGLIGKVEIPRLKISSSLREGVDNQTLDRAVGHVPQTAFPGEVGNVGIAAHRDTYFRNLRDVEKGDVIQVVTPEGTYKYQVDSLRIVQPSQVEVLRPTRSAYLTLVTCYPFNFIGHAPQRFIVRAKQMIATTSPEPKPGRGRGKRNLAGG